MAPETQQLAYFGSKASGLPVANVFDFITSDPFQRESAYTPASQRVPSVEGSRPVFVDHKSGRTLTQAQIKNDPLALAAGLHALGLNPADTHNLPRTPTCPSPEIAPVVLVQLPNCLPFATVSFGALASGMTSTLISPALTAPEISWILQNSRPRVIITATACLPAMREAIGAQEDKAFFSDVPVFTVDVAKDAYPETRTNKAPPGARDWTELLTLAKPLARAVAISRPENSTAVILWSSGTSGRSKGVLLSHNALNFSLASVWYDMEYGPQKRQHWLGYVPFYHVFGLCNIFLLAPCIGASVYVMQQFNLEAVLEAVPRYGVTYFHMAPPVAVMLAKAPIVEKYEGKFGSVIAGVTGGAPLGHEVVVEVFKRLGFRVRLGYGLSETCSTSLQQGIGEKEMEAQAGETGKPHWGVELMIARPDETFSETPLRPAPVGAEGEVLVRCPALLSAYLPVGGAAVAEPDMSVTNEALTRDGWFRTGDVGMLSKEGNLRITDRLKELIKVRAFQVAPAELEAILCGSEEVADAGVVGVYDKDEATEWPRAFVVPRKKGGEEELRALAERLKRLVEGKTAKYKWLQGGIVFVEQVPKSPSGKILRRVMKEGGVKGFEVKLYERKRRDAKL